MARIEAAVIQAGSQLYDTPRTMLRIVFSGANDGGEGA